MCIHKEIGIPVGQRPRTELAAIAAGRAGFLDGDVPCQGRDVYEIRRRVGGKVRAIIEAVVNSCWQQEGVYDGPEQDVSTSAHIKASLTEEEGCRQSISGGATSRHGSARGVGPNGS